MTAPLRLEFDVPCPPDRAFDLWTNRTDLWWPPAHTASGRKGTKIVFEPRAGGRVYEQAPDGSQTDWGHVLEWAPPARLIYRWHLFSDPADATEVEVQFLANTGGSTRVRLEHRGWDAFADGAARRDQNQAGWRQALGLYTAACRP